MSNLDATINEVGYEIAKILDENLINKLLGVLAQDGVYAMWVYALNKVDWHYDEDCEKFKQSKLYKFLEQLNKFPIQIDKKIIDESRDEEICQLTEEINKIINEIKKEKDKKEKQNKEKIKKNKIKEREDKFNEFNEFFLELSKDVNQLLFFKELLEKALIYARYHAKAMKDE